MHFVCIAIFAIATDNNITSVGSINRRRDMNISRGIYTNNYDHVLHSLELGNLPRVNFMTLLLLNKLQTRLHVLSLLKWSWQVASS